MHTPDPASILSAFSLLCSFGAVAGLVLADWCYNESRIMGAILRKVLR